MRSRNHGSVLQQAFQLLTREVGDTNCLRLAAFEDPLQCLVGLLITFNQSAPGEKEGMEPYFNVIGITRHVLSVTIFWEESVA